MPWEVIGQVSSIFSLLAFISATIAWVYRKKLKTDYQLIKSTPENDRAKVILAKYGVIELDATKLNEDQNYQIALTQLENRSSYLKNILILIAIIASLATIVLIIALNNNSELASKEGELKATNNQVHQLIAQVEELTEKLEKEIRENTQNQTIEIVIKASDGNHISQIRESLRPIIDSLDALDKLGVLNSESQSKLSNAKTTLNLSEIIFFQPDMVAYIAFQLLSPEERSFFLKIIENYEFYNSEFAYRIPDEINKKSERETWLFMQASTWPDRIRSPNTPGHIYNYLRWHYISTPIFLDENAKNKFGKSIDIDLEYSEELHIEELNLIQALYYVKSNIVDENTSESIKAVYLFWLLNLVCEIHKPLHTSSLWTKEIFPNSDRGGNMIQIELEGLKNIRLHALWDGAPGRSSLRTFQDLSNKAESLLSNQNLVYQGNEAAINMNILNWYEESYKLASTVVYTKRLLDIIHIQESSGKNQLEPIKLSEEYFLQTGNILKNRLVEASFRLEKVLSEIYNNSNNS